LTQIKATAAFGRLRDAAAIDSLVCARGFGSMNAMTAPKWTISGEFMESCNCDYLCPCIYTNSQGDVTHDHCTSIQVYRIDEGKFGGTKLDGLKFALFIRSGKKMSDGNWVFAGVVDETADEAQRMALTAIVSGEAGGPPAFIRDTLVSDFRGVDYKPINVAIDGLKRAASIPDMLSYAIEGVPSKSEAGSPIMIDNTEHPANKRVALAQSSSFHVNGFGLIVDMDGVGNNGHFAPFDWTP